MADARPLPSSDDVVEALRVIGRALGLLGAAPANADRWYSDRVGELPPGVASPGAMRRRCRAGAFPGARRVGRRWVLSEADYLAALAAAPAPKARTRLVTGDRAASSPPPPTRTPTDDAVSLLAAAGVQLGARGGRR